MGPVSDRPVSSPPRTGDGAGVTPEFAPGFELYSAAEVGYRNYWYPVMFASQLGRKPVAATLLGETVVLFRDQSGVRALDNRCPHRGIPLSEGRQYSPGTLTCPYHGWTFDLNSGELVAVLTDRPDSPICGKVTITTYPAAERIGMIWVYVGDDPPPPIEDDIPRELLEPGVAILGVVNLKRGNWRYAMENAMDEGHARFLHRWGLWQLFREVPAWTEFDVRITRDQPVPWITRSRRKLVWQDTYPRVGMWPPKYFWQSKGGPIDISGRLPCIIRNRQSTYSLYNWWVPVDKDHYLRFMNLTKKTTTAGALLFKLWFHLYAKWARLGLFSEQDQWMIELTQTPPERLYAPDKSITSWRKYCETYARGAPIKAAAPSPSRR